MKVIKGDIVKVISGKDRNKRGEVLLCFPRKNQVVVKGVHIVTRHKKSAGKDKPAGRINFELPVHVSNVQVIDPGSEKPVRIKFKVENGKKRRVLSMKKKNITIKKEVQKDNENIHKKNDKKISKRKKADK